MNEQLSREEVKKKFCALNSAAIFLNFVGFILFILSLKYFPLVLSSAACAVALIGLFLIKKSETLRKELEKNQRKKIENLK